MKNMSAKNKAAGARRTTGAELEDALLPEDGKDLPAPEAAHAGRAPALALHMSLPGTQLDMVLGGPHPLLVELVRHLARTAARDDHAGTQAISNSDDTAQEDL